jgi:transcriptional antiterminator RfaH
MDQTSAFNWFAIQAKPCQEQVAESVVASLALETYLPRVRRECYSRSAWHHKVTPMFPGYLFARFCPAHHLHAVRYSRGVCRVVGAGETPLPVGDQIISEIRERTDWDGCVRLAERSWVPGEVVSLQDGPLRGWTGIFERELDDGRRVAILLEMINHARVVVEKRFLERAALS